MFKFTMLDNIKTQRSYTTHLKYFPTTAMQHSADRVFNFQKRGISRDSAYMTEKLGKNITTFL